jgi:hypothetical protein
MAAAIFKQISGASLIPPSLLRRVPRYGITTLAQLALSSKPHHILGIVFVMLKNEFQWRAYNITWSRTLFKLNKKRER